MLYRSIINIEGVNFCPECSGNIIWNKEKGETVCEQCGLINTERELDLAHKAKRAYSKSEKVVKTRTGNPISPILPDISLCTLIDRRKILNPDLKRAVKKDSHLSWEKRNILIATVELRRISYNLNLPEYIKTESIKLYKKVFKKNSLRGRSIKGMITACIYFTCKKMNIPRTFQEILHETPERPKVVKNCYSHLIHLLNLKVPGINPIFFVSRFTADLNLNIDIEKAAIKLLQVFLKESSISGKDPKGLCAGAIYLASKFKDIKVSQKRIAKTTGVTEITLRARYKEIKNKLNLFSLLLGKNS